MSGGGRQSKRGVALAVALVCVGEARPLAKAIDAGARWRAERLAELEHVRAVEEDAIACAVDALRDVAALGNRLAWLSWEEGEALFDAEERAAAFVTLAHRAIERRGAIVDRMLVQRERVEAIARRFDVLQGMAEDASRTVLDCRSERREKTDSVADELRSEERGTCGSGKRSFWSPTDETTHARGSAR